METKVLFKDDFLTVEVKDGKIAFDFHSIGRLYDTNCPLTAAAIINRTVYSRNKDLLKIEIKDYMDNVDIKTFIYWITGGNQIWPSESSVIYKYAYEDLLEVDIIKKLINDALKSNTIEDALKAINKYGYLVNSIMLETFLE